ncbi:unnamed protein product [Nezara viridula]|uniref:NADH dehydrogenase [ubiquinone] 1 alpha subcomplex subunit 7 n=1 Tax=Nezara viridula TaxID=85310 RepID=A0A9P0MUE1_NEZVI|nr:unnamed protein product [Nezara viridula]
MIEKRNVSPFMQALRRFLLGRPYYFPNNRFPSEMAPRTPKEAPNLPAGVSHKFSDNYYFRRDGRREVRQPEVISSQKRLQ